jgi:hypothetical protein
MLASQLARAPRLLQLEETPARRQSHAAAWPETVSATCLDAGAATRPRAQVMPSEKRSGYARTDTTCTAGELAKPIAPIFAHRSLHFAL